MHRCGRAGVCAGFGSAVLLNLSAWIFSVPMMVGIATRIGAISAVPAIGASHSSMSRRPATYFTSRLSGR